MIVTLSASRIGPRPSARGNLCGASYPGHRSYRGAMTTPETLIAAVDAGDVATVSRLRRGRPGPGQCPRRRRRVRPAARPVPVRSRRARHAARRGPGDGRVRCRGARPPGPPARAAGRGSRRGPGVRGGWVHGAPPGGVLRQDGGGPDAARGRSGRRGGADERARQPATPRGRGRPAHRGLSIARRGRGTDVDATQHGGYTPLHEAAQHGDVELASCSSPPARIRGPAPTTVGRRRPWPRPLATWTWRAACARSRPADATVSRGRRGPRSSACAGRGEGGLDGRHAAPGDLRRCRSAPRPPGRGTPRRAPAPRRWRCST